MGKRCSRQHFRGGNCLKRLVGERGFEPPTPWSRSREGQKSKCFIWCRIEAKNQSFFRLSVGPQLYRKLWLGSRAVLCATNPRYVSVYGINQPRSGTTLLHQRRVILVSAKGISVLDVRTPPRSPEDQSVGPEDRRIRLSSPAPVESHPSFHPNIPFGWQPRLAP